MVPLVAHANPTECHDEVDDDPKCTSSKTSLTPTEDSDTLLLMRGKLNTLLRKSTAEREHLGLGDRNVSIAPAGFISILQSNYGVCVEFYFIQR